MTTQQVYAMWSFLFRKKCQVENLIALFGNEKMYIKHAIHMARYISYWAKMLLANQTSWFDLENLNKVIAKATRIRNYRDKQ